MIVIRRVATLLTALLGVALLLAGAGVLYVDRQLSAAAPVSAEVVLAGTRVTDLDVSLGADRTRALQVLTDGAPAAIGSLVDVAVIDAPLVLGRLADGDRWPSAG